MDPERFQTSRSVTTQARPDVVMDLILEPGTWPQWQPEIVATTGPRRVSKGAVVQGRAQMLGFNVDGQSYTTGVAGTEYSQAVVVGVGMEIRYLIQTTADRTVVTHVLTSSLPKGPLGRVLSFFLARRLRKMQREVLANLIRQAEASSA